jgi:hypothetical protein
MAIETRPARIIFFAALLLFMSVPLLQAQNEEVRFIQRLTWTGDEYAGRYEVVIEKEEGGVYRELRREFTAELFIEFSLLSGKYRCMVIPYNFLDQAGEESPWMYIEVLAARNPELDHNAPRFILLTAESGAALYEMRVSGKNLIPGAEIFLRGSGGERIVPVEIQTGKDGDHVRLLFEEDQLAAGEYELIVINPGGLRAGRSGIPFPPAEPVDRAAYQKKADIFLNAAWMPSFTIYDEKNKEDRFFGQDRSLAGAVFRFGAVSAGSYFRFNPGLELAVPYNFFDSGSGEFHLWGVGINLLALKWFPGDKTALAFRLGAGYSVLFQTNMGVSFLLFVMDNWYLEAGLDYTHWFTDAYPHPSSFRPWVGIGFWK